MSALASPGPLGSPSSDVAARLARLHERVAAAAARAGRHPADVSLVAVSKLQGVDAIAAAVQAGQSIFGESRAQELGAKVGAFGAGVRWHFVGRLQRNKVADVVGVAELVHSVDRLPLALAIAERAGVAGLTQRVLLQVNVGNDPAKGGCTAAQAPALLEQVQQLPALRCEGLMTVPPLGVDPRPAFDALRRLRDRLRERFADVVHLSMGMSDDFEVAVEQGATLVRVGTAVFGPRPARGDQATAGLLARR